MRNILILGFGASYIRDFTVRVLDTWVKQVSPPTTYINHKIDDETPDKLISWFMN